MGANNLVHADDVIIERYAMGRLEEPEVEVFEEHLLVCTSCQGRLARMDEFITSIRAATRPVSPLEVESQPVDLQAHPVNWWRSLQPFRPAIWAGAAFAIALLMLVPVSFRNGSPGLQKVDLVAMRGPEQSPIVKAGAQLELHMDATGLPPSSSYTVEVVNSAGTPVWEGRTGAVTGHITLKISKPLPAGRYWVRVYGSSLKSDLLREFGLTAQ